MLRVLWSMQKACKLYNGLVPELFTNSKLKILSSEVVRFDGEAYQGVSELLEIILKSCLLINLLLTSADYHCQSVLVE